MPLFGASVIEGQGWSPTVLRRTIHGTRTSPVSKEAPAGREQEGAEHQSDLVDKPLPEQCCYTD